MDAKAKSSPHSKSIFSYQLKHKFVTFLYNNIEIHVTYKKFVKLNGDNGFLKFMLTKYNQMLMIHACLESNFKSQDQCD